MKLQEALVLKSTGSWYELLAEDGLWVGRLRGKLKNTTRETTNPVAVGDSVIFIAEDKQERLAVIQDITPRKNYIIRRSPRKKGGFHVLAANLDLLAIVVTVDYPKTSRGFIDRLLVSAEAYTIPSLLIFNKQDLLSLEQQELQFEYIYDYEEAGYECVRTSATTSTGLHLLADEIAGKKVLFSGHSGSGKSTLLNSLIPEANQRTTPISVAVNKGKHTTTFAEMFAYKKGYIIDTPGIKELALVEMESEEIGHYFPEIRKKMEDCRFNNCRHVNEPGCAVIEAVKAGHISDKRYFSYLSMLEDDDNRR